MNAERTIENLGLPEAVKAPAKALLWRWDGSGLSMEAQLKKIETITKNPLPYTDTRFTREIRELACAAVWAEACL